MLAFSDVKSYNNSIISPVTRAANQRHAGERSGAVKTVKAILSALDAQGERLTIQRRAVIQALAVCGDHLTIQAVRACLEQEQGISLSETTIYRILVWLKEVGLASQTDMGAQGIVYALLLNPPHHHLICLVCGRVEAIDDSYLTDLRRRLLDEKGFSARIDHMAIYGHCAQCTTQRAQDSTQA